MARYQATVPSRLGAAETFDYLARFSNAAQWDPGTLAAEQIDPGPVLAGTRFRLTVAFGGRGMPLTYRITRYQPPREVVLEAANGLLRGTDRIVVTDGDGVSDGDGDGVSVRYEAEVVLRGPLRWLDPLLRRGFDTVGERAAAGLALALAGSHGAPGSAEPPGRPVPSGEPGL
jgi:hypothetical protein